MRRQCWITRARVEIAVDAVMLATEKVPNIGLMEKLGMEMDESGFVKTDKYQQTSLDCVCYWECSF